MTKPRKRFGQHFLCDQEIIARIVAAIALKSSDHLVEIGPGQGALTLPVLKKIKKLEVIELDRDLIPVLQERVLHLGELIIHQADVLTFNFNQLVKDKIKLRVFGNLPYNISTPLLFHLLKYANDIEDMTFMLQKEVAERLVAPVSSEHYGRLSVMMQYHCQMELLFNVPPSAFFPPPQVQSSIIKLKPYEKLPIIARDYSCFEGLVKEAFNMRRKTLRNSLKKKVSDEMWKKTGIDPQLRAENLSVKEFVLLSNAME